MMKILGPLIHFILKFIEFISYALKARADHSQTSPQPPTTTVVEVSETSRLQLPNTAKSLQPDTDVEVNLLQSEATAGEHSNLTLRVQPPANAAGGPEEYSTTMRGRQARKDDIQLQWRMFIFGVYLTAGGIVLQVLQLTTGDIPVHNSLQFHCFRMAILFSLAYLTASVYVRPFSDAAALLFEQLALLFGALAFLLVITIADFPHAMVIVSLAVFVASLVIVFLAAYLRR